MKNLKISLKLKICQDCIILLAEFLNIVFYQGLGQDFSIILTNFLLLSNWQEYRQDFVILLAEFLDTVLYQGLGQDFSIILLNSLPI